MEINLFGYTFTATLKKSGISKEVETLAKKNPSYGMSRIDTKLARIKAYRNLTNATLKDSKDWAGSHFAD